MTGGAEHSSEAARLREAEANANTVREDADTLADLAEGWASSHARGNGELIAAKLASLNLALDALVGEVNRWLAWSGGEYPDDSPGDVIAAEADGTITLDDAITTWNPLRAAAFLAGEVNRMQAELEATEHMRDTYFASVSRLAGLLEDAERRAAGRMGGGDDYRLRMVSNARERMHEAEARAVAAEQENADLLNRLEISGELRKEAEQERDDWKASWEGCYANRQRVEVERDRLAYALRDFADHGTRFDTNPTVMIVNDEKWLAHHQWWVRRATDMDRAVRERASRALSAVSLPVGRTAEPGEEANNDG